MMKSLVCAAIAAAAHAKHSELESTTGYVMGPMLSSEDMMPVGQLSIKFEHERGPDDV